MNKRLPDAEAVALRRYDQIMASHEQPPARAVTIAANYAGMPREELQTLIGKRERAERDFLTISTEQEI